jgi:hypothetical protein
MNDRNFVRGLFLMAISLAFGLVSLRYPMGQFSRAGPGLFPLLVSCLLFLIGLITVVRSRFIERVDLNMIAGIVFMVFCVSFAGTSYSVMRNLKISAGLIAVALAFQKLLGFNLPLY